MKILIFSAYYEPEKAASIYLIKNLYEGFAEYGWNVVLYTPVPTRGIGGNTRHYYKRHKKEERVEGRLRITRFPLFREGRNSIQRAVRYIIMNFIFILIAIHEEADVIFVQSTPPTQGAMAAIIKKIKKIPFVYNVQDVFPDSMVSTGITHKNSFVWKIGRRIEKFTYKNADKIVVISKSMQQLLLDKGVPENKVEIVYNWVETDKVVPVDRKDNFLFDEYGLPRDRFYVVYAGNLGRVQNMNVLLEAAKILKRNLDIKFIIFGQGVLEQECKEKALREGLQNVLFYNLLPYEKVSYVYSMGDVGIVSCNKGFGGSILPSKTWSIMAAGSVVVASFDEHTDLQNILESNNIGKFCCANDAVQLADAIIELYQDRDACASMGKRARKFVEDKMSKRYGVAEYVRIIEEVVAID